MWYYIQVSNHEEVQPLSSSSSCDVFFIEYEYDVIIQTIGNFQFCTWSVQVQSWKRIHYGPDAGDANAHVEPNLPPSAKPTAWSVISSEANTAINNLDHPTRTLWRSAHARQVRCERWVSDIYVLGITKGGETRPVMSEMAWLRETLRGEEHGRVQEEIQAAATTTRAAAHHTAQMNYRPLTRSVTRRSTYAREHEEVVTHVTLWPTPCNAYHAYLVIVVA